MVGRFLFVVVVGVLAVASCSSSSYRSCDRNDDCGPTRSMPSDLRCCLDDACRGPSRRGTCLETCDDDRDCPSFARCAKGFCFSICDDDRDCAAGYECRRVDDRTVCAAD